MRIKTLFCVVTYIFLALSCAGCTGKSSGDVDGDSIKKAGAKLPEKVSVVTPQISNLVSASVKKSSLRYAEYSSIGTDYANDKPSIYVYETSVKTLDNINEILCAVNQSAFYRFINRGAYTALVDSNLCKGKDSASTAGANAQNQTSGAGSPNYELWTVNAHRPSDVSPLYVDVWVASNMPGDIPGLIYARAIITEAPSDDNQYGIFALYFKGIPEGQSTPTLRGYIKTERNTATGEILLKFFQNDATKPETRQVTLSNQGTITGSGSMLVNEGGTGVSLLNIAFNDTFLLSEDVLNSANNRCLDRTKFTESAWKYGLYDANGIRINRNSSFNFRYTYNSKDYYGNVGYFGAWVPKEIENVIQNGSVVYRASWDAPGGLIDTTPYTYFKANGKLLEHTKKSMTLSKITGVPVEYYDNTTLQNTRARWNGSDFMIMARLVCDVDNNCYWQDETTPSPINLQSWHDDGIRNFSFWCSSLGGSGNITITNYVVGAGYLYLQPVDTTPVKFDVTRTVFPDEIIGDLYCVENCLWLSGNDKFDYSWNNTTPTRYTFNNISGLPGLLTFNMPGFSNKAVTFENLSSSITNNNPNGVSVAPFTTFSNLSSIRCDNDVNKYCSYKIWDMPVYYSWETGTNSWNQFVGLQNPSNQILRFDQPIQVTYDKPDGTQYILEYNGFGNLWGIPGKCIDQITGDDASCGPNTRWVPEFSIKAGTAVQTIFPEWPNNPPGTAYLKPLEVEQQMTEVSLSPNCDTLTATIYSLPGLELFIDPDIATTPPYVDSPPAVIGGVVQ